MHAVRAIFVIVAISAFAMGAIAFSRASGIDCARAADNVETAICTEPDLGKLDSDLVDAYRAAMERAGRRRRKLLVAQLRFIERRSYCARVDCIYAQTILRIRELEQWK